MDSSVDRCTNLAELACPTFRLLFAVPVPVLHSFDPMPPPSHDRTDARKPIRSSSTMCVQRYNAERWSVLQHIPDDDDYATVEYHDAIWCPAREESTRLPRISKTNRCFGKATELSGLGRRRDVADDQRVARAAGQAQARRRRATVALGRRRGRIELAHAGAEHRDRLAELD